MSNTEAQSTAPDHIRNEFTGNTLDEVALERIRYLRTAFSVLLNAVEFVVPAGRPRSLVVTKLQEACMWAVRGIAENPGGLTVWTSNPTPPRAD
jgi:hypothetical protein